MTQKIKIPKLCSVCGIGERGIAKVDIKWHGVMFNHYVCSKHDEYIEKFLGKCIPRRPFIDALIKRAAQTIVDCYKGNKDDVD